MEFQGEARGESWGGAKGGGSGRGSGEFRDDVGVFQAAAPESQSRWHLHPTWPSEGGSSGWPAFDGSWARVNAGTGLISGQPH